MVKDPICGKPIDPLRARAVGIFGGVTYYFCSADCKAQFKDPRQTPRPEAKKKAEPKVDDDSFEADDHTPPPRQLEGRAVRNDPHGAHDDDDGWDDDADARPPARTGARAWLLVTLLFAVGGAVLFFTWFQK